MGDIIKDIGAFSSAIIPFVNLILPLTALMFFYKLTQIIQSMNHKSAIEVIDQFYKRTVSLFNHVLTEVRTNHIANLNSRMI